MQECLYGGMVDAIDSKSIIFTGVLVRVRLGAPYVVHQILIPNSIIMAAFRTIALITTLSILTFIHACFATEMLYGFNIDGYPINPVCIYKVYPSPSEKNMIIRSIFIQECQNSNFGFHEGDISVQNNTVSTTVNGKTVKYEVFGRTNDGIFIIMLDGNIMAAYTLDDHFIISDFLERKKRVSISKALTVVGYSFIPCFKVARVYGNIVVIESNVYDASAPRAEQCKEEICVNTYRLSGLEFNACK